MSSAANNSINPKESLPVAVPSHGSRQIAGSHRSYGSARHSGRDPLIRRISSRHPELNFGLDKINTQLTKRHSRNLFSKTSSSNKSGSAYLYVDLENNNTFETREPYLDPKRFRKIENNQIELPTIDVESGEFVSMTNKPRFEEFQHLNEIHDPLGWIWRQIIKHFILLTWDEVNALRITRTLQFHLFVQTGYEGYLLDELLVAFTAKDMKRLSYVLHQCLRNRNVSRIIVRTIRTTWDYVYHIDNLFRYGKYLDGFQQTFFFTGYGFPASENFVNTRDFTVSVFFRALFGEGSFITRTFAGRQALQTDNVDVIAQNLAAEVTGFETANRNQYGTYLGRLKTNEFRKAQRLPVDESLVRSFQTLTFTTIVNNGVENCLLQLARHWHNMLYQFDGNFAHQRMEQLNPFQFLRFQFPPLLVAMAIHRGICSWDRDVLAPFVTRLQLIKPCPEMADITLDLIKELREHIAVGVCGGIASRIDPMLSLAEAMERATEVMTEEAYDIDKFLKVNKIDFILSNVRSVVNNVDWSLPSTSVLQKAVIASCQNKETVGVCRHATRRAINLLAPKDKRTLIELCNKGYSHIHSASLLVSRTVTLLEREIRRSRFDAELIELSKGEIVPSGVEFSPKFAYWITDEDGKSDVYIYQTFVKGAHKFENRATRNVITLHGTDSVEVRYYVEVAELITLAQWIFMKIELDFGKKFTYSGLMEYDFIREQLRFLIVVSQIQSYSLDDARLNRLQAVQNANFTEVALTKLEPLETYYYYQNKQYEVFNCPADFNPSDPKYDFLKTKKIVTIPPQSMIMIGGGPTGLLGALHCLENVLYTDGTMTLYESRDAYTKGGSAFERSQIVRLDSRWIAMLRYHLGTVYEDVFVPAAGETDSHYGNQLPFQGFIEITIKDMENMMHIQVAKAASRGLLKHFTNASCVYDYDGNQLIKLGKNLVPGDLILKNIDENGKVTQGNMHTWQVVELVQIKQLSLAGIQPGDEVVLSGIYTVGNSFKCIKADEMSRVYEFENVKNEEEIVKLSLDGSRLPFIYPKGTKLTATIESIIIENILRGSDGSHVTETLKYNEYENIKFILDVGETHVCTAIGKPHDEHHHFETTTLEPYGVCCLSGLKVSMLMHNFGTRRWRLGFVDDIRSGAQNDQNTRVVGDFTKIVNSRLIAENMVALLKTDVNFKFHFIKIAEELGFDASNPVYWNLLVSLVELYRSQAPYKRRHLQTRFFETGDNFYLGMEFTREYDDWKTSAVEGLVALLIKENNFDKIEKSKDIESLNGIIAHNIDRLWYQATLNTIKQGDVYNPGGKSFIPDLIMLDSSVPTMLSKLDIAESFRLHNVSPEAAFRRYEVMLKPYGGKILCRDHEGYICELDPSTMVLLGGNLTRGPDGATESRVSIATFPVGHLVNHRTMRLSNTTKGYAVAFFGDEQSSPHFMRYSGLTGAAINVMLFDNYIANVSNGVPLTKAYGLYSASTRWSNGEVVQRGTNTNYGEDAFLRPGFPYSEGIRYLYANIFEHVESEQDMHWVLSRDWKIKFAAALIPRGLENNNDFLKAFTTKIQSEVFDFVCAQHDAGMSAMLKKRRSDMIAAGDKNVEYTEDTRSSYWADFLQGLNTNPDIKSKLTAKFGAIFMMIHLELVFYKVIKQAQVLKKYNSRVSSQSENQPPSVDAFIDDFAVEAQPTTNILVQASTYAAISLAISFRSTAAAAVFSAIFWWFSIGTISNTSRYKNRNEEWRVKMRDDQFINVLTGVYGAMKKTDREIISNDMNPFIRVLQKKVDIFVSNCRYYNIPKPNGFLKMYSKVLKNPHCSTTIRNFMHMIATKYIVEEYYISSYIQENLVDIYFACNEMANMEAMDDNTDSVANSEAKVLFKQLLQFENRLENTLQRGVIKYGAFKQSSWKHNHIIVMFLYFRNLIWFVLDFFIKKLCFKSISNSFKHSIFQPLAAETWEVISELQNIADRMPESRSTELRRQIVDMTSLYYASMESYTSSFVIISGYLSFTTSSLFVVANIGIQVNPESLAWEKYAEISRISVGSITPITSIAAGWYLFRQLKLLWDCSTALSYKQQETLEEEASKNLKDCLSIMRSTAIVTFVRALASFAAAVGLPFALAHSLGAYPTGEPALWLAVSAVGAQIICNLILFYIEYNPLYNLPPKLGEFIGVAFDDEIRALKKSFTIPKNDIQADIVQERQSWHYTAQAFLHKYRFDSAFAANRFGSIWQYIQSGLLFRPNDFVLVISEDNPDMESYRTLTAQQTSKQSISLKKYKFTEETKSTVDEISVNKTLYSGPNGVGMSSNRLSNDL